MRRWWEYWPWIRFPGGWRPWEAHRDGWVITGSHAVNTRLQKQRGMTW